MAPIYTEPEIIPYEGEDFLKILMFGDSLAAQAGGDTASILGGVSPKVLEPLIAATGRSVQVIQESVPGTGPARGAIPLDWADRLPGLIKKHKPDILLSHLGGNSYKFSRKLLGFVPYGGRQWQRANRRGAVDIMQICRDSRIPTYWCLTPAVEYNCNKKLAETKGLIWFRDLTRFQLMPRFQSDLFHFIDWATFFTPNNVYTSYLNIDGNDVQVRADDCIHFSAAGVDIAAHICAWYMQGEWQ